MKTTTSDSSNIDNLQKMYYKFVKNRTERSGGHGGLSSAYKKSIRQPYRKQDEISEGKNVSETMNNFMFNSPCSDYQGKR